MSNKAFHPAAPRERPRFRVPARSGPIAIQAPPAPVVPQASYQGAGHGPRSKTWHDYSYIGNNAALQAGLADLRGRSWLAYRNDSLARSAINRFCEAAVGTGARLRLKDVPHEFRKEVLRLWSRWVRQADSDQATTFHGLQFLALREAIIGGDCFVRFRPRPTSDEMAVPLQIELLSSDYCPETKNEPAGLNEIRAGIELTAYGRRVAYHFYRSNPRDTRGWMRRPADLQTVRVRAEVVAHLRPLVGAGTLRGEPLLSPALADMRALADYQSLEMSRKASAAGILGFVEPPPGEVSNQETDAVPGAEDGEGFEEIQAGTIKILKPGEKFTFASTPDVGGQYAVFVRQQILYFAAALGLPYEVLTGDFKDSSDRTFQATLTLWREAIASFQWHVLEPQLLYPIWTAWVDAALANGAIAMPAGLTVEDLYEAAEWGFPEPRYMRVVQDVEAAKLGVENYLESWSAAVARRGEDPDQVAAEIAADKARFEALGLPWPPLQWRNAGAGSGGPGDPSQPPAAGPGR